MSRITLVANSLGHGGSEKQAAFIGTGLLARGWDVRVVSILGRDDYSDPNLAARTTVLGKRGKGDFSKVVRAARAAIDPDAPVLCFNWYPHVVTRLAVPSAPRIARFGGLPSADGVTGFRRLMARNAQRSALAVVGCTWGVVRQAVSELGDPRLFCACIPNGIHFRAVDSATQSAWPVPYLLAAGRLSSEKDHETLLRAFALLAPHVEHDLLIAGDGAEESRLRSLIGELELSGRAHILGYRSDLPSLLSGADLLVHTSRWEGFGNVLVEAMAVGTPVVATDAPFGPPSILATVPGGVLVPVGDARAIADAVLALLRDPSERERLAEIGREGVPRHYGTDALINAYETLVASVIHSNKGALR